MAKSKVFEGIDIREVFDFRLSTVTAQITRQDGTWVVDLFSKNNHAINDDNNSVSKPIESYDTGIVAEVGDEYDVSKVKKCFEWIYAAREKYSLPHIEQRKPVVAMINSANKELGQINLQISQAKTQDEADMLRGRLSRITSERNAEIKSAVSKMNSDIEKMEDS